jgi:hypothetical protein
MSYEPRVKLEAQGSKLTAKKIKNGKTKNRRRSS